MKVLQVSQFYPPHTGGIENVVRQLSEGLVRRGHDVDVLTGVSQGVGETDQQDGVTVYRMSGFGVFLSVPLTPSLPYRLRKCLPVYDIVHYHLPHPSATIAHFFADTTDTAVVATYHSDIVRQQVSEILYRPVLKRFLDRVDRIIATSPPMIEHSDVLGEFARKCDVIPLAVDMDDYGSPDGKTGNGNPDIREPTLLFVGRLNYYKGLRYLIEAMNQVDAQLLIAGSGDRREELEHQVNESNLTEKVRFLGYVPDEQLPSYYQEADLFVLPSSEPSEAFGIVQLEAMAHGTPVVNTDLQSGVPWVSQDGHTGITVPPKDSQALADAINQLLTDSKLREVYRENARQRVVNSFTEERFVEATEALYKEII